MLGSPRTCSFSIRREQAMRRVLERCAALDVHKKQVTACARILGEGGELEELTVEFATMAADLLAMRDWLTHLGVTHVAMEATGVYWKPVYYALEDDFELLLVNAQHVKNVPGRKTDTNDAMALPATRVRAAQSELRAAQADPRAARADPVSQGPDTRACERSQPVAEDARGRRDQALLRGLRRAWRLRSADT